MKTNQDEKLAALGDPTRRSILEDLARRPQAVSELASAFPISRPAISQHLKILKDAGLLTVRSAGTRRIYAADPSGIAEVRAAMERLWRDALVAFKDAAENTAEHLDRE